MAKKYEVKLVITENRKEIKKHLFLSTDKKKQATEEFRLIVQSDDAIRGIADSLGS